MDDIILHPLLEPEINEGKVTGIFEINDPNFGNDWTNIPTKDFLQAGFGYGDTPLLTIRHNGEEVFSKRVLFHQSFGYANKGDVMIYNNELMRISVAVNQGSFTEEYQIGFGPEWTVTIRK